MLHLDIYRARNVVSDNGPVREIQLHQHLNSFFEADFRLPDRPEVVDAAKPALYKTGNGGGRNPAAAVL